MIITSKPFEPVNFFVNIFSLFFVILHYIADTGLTSFFVKFYPYLPYF